MSDKVNKLLERVNQPAYGGYGDMNFGYEAPTTESFYQTEDFYSNEKKKTTLPKVADFIKHPEFDENCIANQYSWKGVKEPVTKEEIEAWIVALESGDYDNKITLNRLQSGSGENCSFCALGVLAKEKGDLDDGTLQPGSGSLGTNYIPSKVQSHIYSYNDSGQQVKTPQQIADKVKEVFGL